MFTHVFTYKDMVTISLTHKTIHICHMYTHISSYVHVNTNEDVLTHSLAGGHASKHTLTHSLTEIYSSIRSSHKYTCNIHSYAG